MSNKTGGSTGFFKWTVSATSHDGEEMGAALHGLSYTLYETVTATDSVIVSRGGPVQNFKVGVGSFAASTSSSTQSITDVGFQPKAILVYWTNETAAHDFNSAPQNNIQFGFGITNSSSLNNQFGVNEFSDDGVATTNTFRNSTNQTLIGITTHNGATRTLIGLATLNSFTANGFDLSWKKIPTKAVIIHYIAFGGTDITKAGVGKFDTTAGAGTQSITGPNFKPDFLMLMSATRTSASENQATGNLNFGIGFATNPLTGTGSNQTSLAITSPNGVSPSTTFTRTNQTGSMNLLNSDGTDNTRAKITSFDPTGFTVTKDFSSTGQLFYYLALQGGRYSVGNFTKSTSVGSQSVTKAGMGFTPAGLLLYSNDKIGNATDTASKNARLSFGAGNGTKQGSIWLHDTNNLNPTSAKERESSQYIAMHGFGTTLNAEAGLTSLNPNGFTLNWDKNNAQAQQIMYVAFGSALPTSNLAETVTATDSVTKTLTKTLSETVTATDSVSTAHGAKITLNTETVTATDSVTNTLTKTLSETVTATDPTITTVLTGATLTKSLFPPSVVTATDTITKEITKILSETVTITDPAITTILTGAALTKILNTETVTATDSVSTAHSATTTL
ncbi:MAG: hypothetical protein E6K83_08470, partial [Thaumarchaeota archaeon]